MTQTGAHHGRHRLAGRLRYIGGSRSLSAVTSGDHLGRVSRKLAVWPLTTARLPSGSYLAAPAMQVATM
jgi:hypothetical protein